MIEIVLQQLNVVYISKIIAMVLLHIRTIFIDIIILWISKFYRWKLGWYRY